METLVKIISEVGGIPLPVLIIVLPFALVAWIAWLLRDNVKEWLDMRKELSTTTAPKCTLCKYQVANGTRRGIEGIRDKQLELLDRQMKSVENMCTRLKDTLCTSYLPFLQKFCPTADNRGWEMMLVSEKIGRAFYTQLLPGMRQMLKENHLAQREDIEFLKYKDLAISTIRAGLMSFVDAEYIDQYSVPRIDKRKFFEQAFDTLIDQSIRIELDSARDLARIYEKDIQEIETRLTEQMETQR